MDWLNVQVHRYHLSFVNSLKRNGALLKVTFQDGLVGYADCHPWTEFGDLALNEQLKMVQTKEILRGTLIERSLFYAGIDSEARAAGKNLLASLSIPRSHYLCIDPSKLSINELPLIKKKGYKIIKIKVGNHPDLESRLLNELSPFLINYGIKLRIDCNEKFSEMGYLHFINSLPTSHEIIDFVEDPFPFDPLLWEKTRIATQIPLACDHKISKALPFPDAYDVLVRKPAVQEQPTLGIGKRLVITSYFDHPLGQSIAAYEAAKHCPNEICGLQTHLHYKPEKFMESLSFDTPEFIQSLAGSGFGFDHYLNKLEWTDV